MGVPASGRGPEPCGADGAGTITVGTTRRPDHADERPGRRCRREGVGRLAGPAERPPLSRERAEALARDDEAWVRAQAAADPRLPADRVAALATDPSPYVRLAGSGRRPPVRVPMPR